MAKIGDIFVATWGYDQTNADFFQVVKVRDKTISIQHIKSKITESSPQSMSGYSVPIRNAFDGKVKTKKLRTFYGKEVFEAGESMGLAEEWNGDPVGISWYA